jgi:hypothetical protein
MKPVIHLIPIVKFINPSHIVVIDSVLVFVVPPDFPCAFAYPIFAVKQDLFPVPGDQFFCVIPRH